MAALVATTLFHLRSSVQSEPGSAMSMTRVLQFALIFLSLSFHILITMPFFMKVKRSPISKYRLQMLLKTVENICRTGVSVIPFIDYFIARYRSQRNLSDGIDE